VITITRSPDRPRGPRRWATRENHVRTTATVTCGRVPTRGGRDSPRSHRRQSVARPRTLTRSQRPRPGEASPGALRCKRDGERETRTREVADDDPLPGDQRFEHRIVPVVRAVRAVHHEPPGSAGSGLEHLERVPKPLRPPPSAPPARARGCGGGGAGGRASDRRRVDREPRALARFARARVAAARLAGDREGRAPIRRRRQACARWTSAALASKRPTAPAARSTAT
jgi:hypothetical protein